MRSREPESRSGESLREFSPNGDCSNTTEGSGSDCHNSLEVDNGTSKSLVVVDSGSSVALCAVGDSPLSTISERELSRIKDLYSFPKDCNVYVPSEDQRVDSKVPGKVFFYETAFKLGLRLPLPSFVKEVLSYYKVAPSQLMPNAWRLLLGLQVLSESHEVDVTIKSLQYSYYLKTHDHEKWRIQINLKPRRRVLVQVPSKGDPRRWKEKYFLVEDAYVFGRDGPRGVPSSWRSIDTTNDRIHHQKELLSWRNVQGILSIPVEKRSWKVLTPQSLARTSIWLIRPLSIILERTVRLARPSPSWSPLDLSHVHELGN